MPKVITKELRNDPKAHRAMILYEFYSGKPIFECYKNFCERLGEDFIKYNEFEFWFMRFAKGKFDMDYDRRTELKHPHLLDLPNEVLDKVLKNLKSNDRFPVRHTCRLFRNLIDSCVAIYKEIKIVDLSRVTYDGTRFSYYNSSKRGTAVCDVRDIYNREISFEVNGQPKDMLIEHLTSILKHPEFDLPLMVFHNNGGLPYREIVELFVEVLNDKHPGASFVVRNLRFQWGFPAEFMPQILPFIRPETLETITYNCAITKQDAEKAWISLNFKFIQEGITEYLKQNQFHPATMLKFIVGVGPRMFPSSMFLNCPRITVTFTEHHITQPMAKKLVTTLLKSKSLQLCYLEPLRPEDKNGILEYLKAETGLQNINPARPYMLRHENSDSGLVFEVEVKETSICIERT